MKTLLYLLIFSLLSSSLQAQFNPNAPWMKTITAKKKATEKPVPFSEIVTAFQSYWKTKDFNKKGSGYKPFKRWENHWKSYTKKDGTLLNTKELWATWLAFKEQENTQKNNGIIDESNWEPVGPFTHVNTSSWSSGQGRVNAIAVDPNQPNVYYAGAPAGGIWKSTNSGTTWQPLTDFLPQIGVSGIAIDGNNSNTIYIATGDDDAGDSKSAGVFKSIDGGATWQNTGINPSNTPEYMNDIYIHPTNSNTIWVATYDGVFKTTNGGTNWSNANGTQNEDIKDLKIHPTNPNIIYAASYNTFYKSTDGGNSFSIIYTGLPNDSSRLVLDVTPANPNVVYVFSASADGSFQGIYKSTNAGSSFFTIATLATVGDIFDGSEQSWFDMAFAVSDTNENEIYTGVLNIWKGIVNGTSSTFTKLNDWSSPNEPAYTHADIHFLRFFNNALYVGSDGGFYKSTNGGTSFTDLTQGLQISQFYKIAVAKQTSEKMVGGLQDNGGYAYNNSTWQNYYGADGMDTAIHPNNSNTYYGFIQGGSALYISSTAGATITNQVYAPEQGNWVTPLQFNTEGELYSGFGSLYKLNDGTWQAISSPFSANIDLIEIDKTNPDIMYVAINNQLFKSTNRGLNFTLIETFTEDINSIAVHSSNSAIVYIATYFEVFQSFDGGISFTNISGSLPSVIKTCVKHQDMHPDNPLFLATSLGVYRYDDVTLDWQLFNTNLPNVEVTDLEINIFDQTLTAATYGRGIWKTAIPTQAAPTDVQLNSVIGLDASISCNSNYNPEVTVKNTGLNTISSLNFQYYINNTSYPYNWNGNLATEQETTVTLPNLNLSLGINTFYVEVTTTNDTYSVNNVSESYTLYKNDFGTTNSIHTFENASDELLVIDESSENQYWQRGVPSGTLLNNAGNPNPNNKVYGTNLTGNHADEIKSYLISNCYDLTTIAMPYLKFDMAFDLELDWDIIYVEYSIDAGTSWNLLGTANDPNWYNSDTTLGENNTCYNCLGAQWTGTVANMTAYQYNLANFSTEENIMFRFVFHSDQSVNQEGVIIDNLEISGIPLNVTEFSTNSVALYPNPASSTITIKTLGITNYSAAIYDITGKIVYQKKEIQPQQNTYTLPINKLESGMYLIQISNANQTITKKIIVN